MYMESVIRAHDLLSNAHVGQSGLVPGNLNSRQGIVSALDRISKEALAIKSSLAESGAIPIEVIRDLSNEAASLCSDQDILSKEKVVRLLTKKFFDASYHGVANIPGRLAIVVLGGVGNFVL